MNNNTPGVSAMLRNPIPKHFLHDAERAIEAAGSGSVIPIDRRGWCTPDHPRTSLDLNSVATALAWIQCGPVLRDAPAAQGLSSYAAKHLAERWGRIIGFENYVGNGDMLTAGLFLEVPMILPPNAGINPNAILGLRALTAAARS